MNAVSDEIIPYGNQGLSGQRAVIEPIRDEFDWVDHDIFEQVINGFYVVEPGESFLGTPKPSPMLKHICTGLGIPDGFVEEASNYHGVTITLNLSPNETIRGMRPNSPIMDEFCEEATTPSVV